MSISRLNIDIILEILSLVDSTSIANIMCLNKFFKCIIDVNKETISKKSLLYFAPTTIIFKSNSTWFEYRKRIIRRMRIMKTEYAVPKPKVKVKYIKC